MLLAEASVALDPRTRSKAMSDLQAVLPAVLAHGNLALQARVSIMRCWH